MEIEVEWAGGCCFRRDAGLRCDHPVGDECSELPSDTPPKDCPLRKGLVVVKLKGK